MRPVLFLWLGTALLLSISFNADAQTRRPSGGPGTPVIRPVPQPERITTNALTFQGVWPEDAPIEASSPALTFIGVNPSEPISVTAAELTFHGVWDSETPIETTTQALTFVGTNPATPIAVTSPVLTFAGVQPEAIQSPQLSFQGVWDADTPVTASSPTLTFQGTNPAGPSDIASSSLTFVGVWGTETPVQTVSPALSFVGTGGSDAEMSGDNVRFARMARSASSQVEISLRQSRNGSPNLRRLSVSVALAGSYQPPRRNGLSLVLVVDEGPDGNTRTTLPASVPSIADGTNEVIGLDLTLRGTGPVPPGQWPELTNRNAHAHYQFVRITAQLLKGEGSVQDRIGPFCYDAARQHLVDGTQCTRAETQRRDR